MDELKEECERVLTELYSFSSKVLYLGPHIIDDRIEDFEKEIGFLLPEDFKYLLKKHNGFSVLGTGVKGFRNLETGESISEMYHFEHFETAHKMPIEFLPFSPDGFGNHYCLHLGKLTEGICPVVFWQWDYEYVSISEVEECNGNFLEWIEEVIIEWGKTNLQDMDLSS